MSAKILIANRGEIALRIHRAIKSQGMQSVAVYTEADLQSPHLRVADEIIRLEGNRAAESYLNGEALIQAAIQSSAEAVHPGYGFLSENAEFAQAVNDAGLRFIGPRAETIGRMGDKATARSIAEAAGVPVVPGTEASADVAELGRRAATLGYPLMIKAVAGGSGRGMRVCKSAQSFPALLEEAMAEAKAAFANEAVLLERFVERPRHIEVQIFGDGEGKVLHIGERECSVQRRRQKLVEEACAANLHPKLADKIRQAAVRLGEREAYLGAGTVEFLLEGGSSPDDPFYFLEMNTRIQVEHPVTELVSGLDLVEAQIKTAFGTPLGLAQQDVSFRGHAIEFRIYAEDVRNDFSPLLGPLHYIGRPSGAGIREDTWMESGMRITPYYDALISKLCIWGEDRTQACRRAQCALDEYCIDGLATTLDFHRWLVRQEAFLESAIDISWVEREYQGQTRASTMSGAIELPPAPRSTRGL